MKTESQVSRAIARLVQAVLDGELKPGQQIYGQRTLMARLGVSKTVLREALRSLADRGLISIQAGVGVQILDPINNGSVDLLNDLIAARDEPVGWLAALLELRSLVWGLVGVVACRRRTIDHVEQLLTLCEELELLAAIREPDSALEEHEDKFRDALIRMTDATALGMLIFSIERMVARAFRGREAPPLCDNSVRYQRMDQLTEAVAIRSEESARKLLEDWAKADGEARRKCEPRPRTSLADLAYPEGSTWWANVMS